MAVVSQKVLNWLHSVLIGEYVNVNRSFSDIAQALSQSTLRPQTDVYTFENGRSSLLLHLTGTVPVSFRGATYSFPISIWVPQAYPRESPLAFVTPDKGMAIRPGQHVSGEGRIYHPYLASWKEERSTIAGLLRVLQEIFSREPPVVSKQEQMARSNPLRNSNGSAPPVPPLPPQLGRPSPSERRAESQSFSPNQPPPPPPKPYQETVRFGPSQSSVAPPLPPHPPLTSEWSGTNYTPGHQPQQPRPISQYSSTAQNASSNVQQAHLHQWQPQGHGGRETMRSDTRMSAGFQAPQQGFQTQIYPNQYTKQGQTSPQHQELGYNVNYQNQPTQPPITQPSRDQHFTPQIHHSKPPEDLLTSPFDTVLPTQLSAVNIPAPPIPPNPEKDALLSAISRTLTEHLQNTLQSNAAAIPSLNAQHVALQNAFQKMQQEHQALLSLQSLLSSNEAILHKAMQDADQCILDAKHRTVPGVDEVLVAPTIVGEQLYNLVAEELACVETREVLGKALDKGRLGVEGWVKGVRSLAREEFLKKVLIRKCAEGMGLRRDEDW